ncbi:hypothetical protein GGR54DRAFT_208201 [Hypoxylon sp. NC1633]|nr:hypothetical protein GGR54DRAFT_208201 [Hypoxylon sp. NC1633]
MTLHEMPDLLEMEDVDGEVLDINDGINPELGIDFNIDSLEIDDVNLEFLDPLLESDSSSKYSREKPDSDRAYHAKRPHKKSRAGCQQCKRRKVKCDEARPRCKNCRLRKEDCKYPKPPSTSLVTRPKTDSVTSSLGTSPRADHEYDDGTFVVAEPLFRPREMTDELDMKMLWFYTTQGFHSFSIQSGRSSIVDHVLQVKVVEHAFQSPFLMDCLMATSSMELQAMNQKIPFQRAVSYRARAFEGYRSAIERAEPRDFPALLACSLLMIAASSEMFRDTESKRLYIIDWMLVWRGIGLIVEIVSPPVLEESGMAVLFYRPPVDLERAATYIPNNLLFMVASIKAGDTDEEYKEVYYDMLKYLGSLYQELREHGFNAILDLRIITFFTFVPKPFVPLAQEHRPRALIMLAHHLCFVKMTANVWWMAGIADREIKQICREVDEEWAHLLRVPQMVLRTTDRIEIARLIIDNRNWTPAEMDEYERMMDPRLMTEPKLHNNEGSELMLYQGRLRRKSSILSTDYTAEEISSMLTGC